MDSWEHSNPKLPEEEVMLEPISSKKNSLFPCLDVLVCKLE